MADPELEELRKQRLAELQSQYQVSFYILAQFNIQTNNLSLGLISLLLREMREKLVKRNK